MFDADHARKTLAELERKGVELGPPLAQQDLERAEEVFRCEFPPELRALLLSAVPLGKGWIDWREDPAVIAERADAHIVGAFEFDIRVGQYWFDEFGPQPDDADEAVHVAVSVVRRWPPLIPIYGHRVMPTAPGERGNPVLSVYQAADSIYYGNDLADYLHREFAVSRPHWARDEPRAVPKWGRAFDL